MSNENVVSPSAPIEDTRIVEIAADTAISTYARDGEFSPLGIIETASGYIFVPAEGPFDQDGKLAFLNVLRFLSIENAGRRSALAVETWTVFSNDPADVALVRQIQARGGSLKEHPRAGEAIYIIAESDAGFTSRMHRIIRDGKQTTLEPGIVQFEESGKRMSGGLFSNFHVPTALQMAPGTQEFAAFMRQIVSARYQVIKTKKGPQVN